MKSKFVSKFLLKALIEISFTNIGLWVIIYIVVLYVLLYR